MLDWRIYYCIPGETIDSSQSAPELVPKTDVAYILQRHPETGEVRDWHGTDYYVWEWGGWWGRTESGLYQYMTRPGSKIVLYGYHTRGDWWNEVAIAAQNDPDFH